jgi:hypothetical protein
MRGLVWGRLFLLSEGGFCKTDTGGKARPEPKEKPVFKGFLPVRRFSEETRM